jgi:uncharacterized protein YijF (DUF1287 family)
MRVLAALLLIPTVAACDRASEITARLKALGREERVNKDWTNAKLAFGLRLAAAAEERARHRVIYDASYERIAYPNGDVAPTRGVCADEIVRAFRLVGIDLQQLVHEDMGRAFHAYPKRWGLKRPDPNIDHRRVPNLATFFERHGNSFAPSTSGANFKPGDVVAWALADGRPHIGLVTEQRSDDGQRPLVMHNIGFGPQIEDMLFELKVTGHYRYLGPRATNGLGAPRATK